MKELSKRQKHGDTQRRGDAEHVGVHTGPYSVDTCCRTYQMNILKLISKLAITQQLIYCQSKV